MEGNFHMSLSFCSLSSGSTGNCYVVFDEDTAVLVDAGISGKKILNRLEEIGIEKDKIKALLITHEHIDHIKSVRIINKKLEGIATYASCDTWEFIECDIDGERQKFVTTEPFHIGGIKVVPFKTSHDAKDAFGYSFVKGDCQISILTDTGFVTESAYDSITEADLLVLEANHDPQVLRMCNRPLQVIKRIAGNKGHLSNEDAGKCLARIIKSRRKPRQILLAHLSGENNSSELAELTVRNVLEENRISIGDETRIDVIKRDILSPVYTVNEI